MTRQSNPWATKVASLIQGGNASAALAQIKVAPTVKDLKALQAALEAGQLKGRWRTLDTAVEDNLALLSAPRLHRSP